MKDAETDLEIQACFAVMSELRTHLSEQEFVPAVRHMESEGFRLAFVVDDDGDVVAVAGYRIFTNLFVGKNLYVDDLVTSEKVRSKGYGKIMMEWLRDKARADGCNYFRLDSGTARARAHKFYFDQGMSIAAYHFSERL